MLLQKLIIKNFKGISEKQEIDLSVPNKAKENLKNNLMFKKEGSSLIPLIIGLMGKNASSKTSIISAISFTIDLFFNPERSFNEFYSQRIINKSQVKNRPFNFNINSMNNRLINNFLQLTFENKKRLFIHEYNEFLEKIFNSFSHDQKNPIEIEIFFKNKIDVYKIKLIFKKNELERLSYKNNQQIEIKNFPIISFLSLQFINLNFNVFLDEFQYEILSILDLQYELIELIGRKKYNLILKMIDNNIKEINFTIDNAKKIKFTSLHMNNKTIIPFHSLSTGTIKILKFISIIMIQNFKSKNIFIIFLADEINNYLHAKLVDFLFKLLSKNLSNSQLIFTTHSPSIMENLDRHAIWVIQNEDRLKIRKVGSILREDNSFYKKFITEEISSHPSNFEINEVLYELSKK